MITTMTLRPAVYIYSNYGLPRAQLRELAEAGVIRSEERLSIDGVNMMRLYCIEDIDSYLAGGAGNDTSSTDSI